MKLNLNKVGIKFIEFNVDLDKNNMVAALRYIKGFPTLIIAKDISDPRSEIIRFPGLRPVGELEKIKLKYANL